MARLLIAKYKNNNEKNSAYGKHCSALAILSVPFHPLQIILCANHHEIQI